MRVIRDQWLVVRGLREGRQPQPHGGGRTVILLSEAFDRWERVGIELGRPFTVVVDTVANTLTVEQEKVAYLPPREPA